MSRALVVSLIVHLVVLAVVVRWLHRDEEHEVELVDIEVAPPPPIAEALPEEVARQIEQAAAERASAAAGSEPAPKEPGEGATVIDAGIDAPPDAPPDAALVANKHVDAGSDAIQVASADAMPADAGGETVAAAGSGSG
ncbi:MAG TPA: hypothetical protein VFQ65_29325, partial [Kofleriaceae bacterium]|nr:hypothetical protein [Kofleriaceae bacterium]